MAKDGPASQTCLPNEFFGGVFQMMPISFFCRDDWKGSHAFWRAKLCDVILIIPLLSFRAFSSLVALGMYQSATKQAFC